MTIYFCCNERRNALLGNTRLNGIDFLEVLDGTTVPMPDRQRTLFVHFVNPVGSALKVKNFRLEGGERIRDIQVESISSTDSRTLAVQVNEPGDFSIYTLRLVTDANHPEPPHGIDEILAAIEFSFKVECKSEFDCQSSPACAPESPAPPNINYLAKDYPSFRRLMLDRMSELLPDWTERNPADVGIALVETLAYVADYLSYEQDAVATESYLGTARRRVSVRRHARLLDYAMHDGCNARAWAQARVRADLPDQGPGKPALAKGTKLVTRMGNLSPRIEPAAFDFNLATRLRAEVFETMHDVAGLYQAHNEMRFYSWGDRECCLPQGATRATLRGSLPNLQRGDVLIFKEARGPFTGEPEDADPAHRHAVRLTSVDATKTDPLGNVFDAPPNPNPPLLPVTAIEWDAADALPFALCISARTDTAHGEQFIDDVSLALGNIVLADHGCTINAAEPLGAVPPATLSRVRAASVGHCQERTTIAVPPRFRPALQQRPLTQAATVTRTKIIAGRHEQETIAFDDTAPAASAVRWEMRNVLPAILTCEDSDNNLWKPQHDLLASDKQQREFVVEVEEDGLALLRFGDGINGARPKDGTSFAALYRIGNGTRGNVGAATIAHIITGEPIIDSVTNPLPARGGLDAETMESVRQRAPVAFRTQERAVTPDDYARVAERHPQIQKAVAAFRWTGSWRTVFLTIDRTGGCDVDEAFKAEMRRWLERYRMAGHDVEIDGPRDVPLEINMRVCAKKDYFDSDVEAALLALFNNRTRPDGRRGVFHPDNFTFAQTVYLSPLYAAAQSVAGVDYVRVTTFQRWGETSNLALATGKLTLGRLEIARLDNDPSFPDRGVFRLTVEGGR